MPLVKTTKKPVKRIANCIVSTQHKPLTETQFPNNH